MNELLFLEIFNRSLTSCWLILTVFVLRYLLKKAPGYFRIVLWIIVGIRLILPFDIRTDFSLIPSAEPLSPYTVQYEAHPSIDTGVNAIDDTINPVFSEVFKADPESSVNPLHVWVFVIGCIWLIGFAILLAYSVISYLRFCGMLKDAVPEADNILISDHIGTPFVLGIINPKIYLPSSLGEKDKAHVLAHERKHIQRKDHILKPAAYLITALHWFNPLVWISYILFCRDLELSCDEAVIKEMDLNEKKDYALALLNCQAHRRTVLAYPLAFGETDVKKRVTSILHHKKPAYWAAAAGIVLCLVTAICFLTNPRSSQKNYVPAFLDSIILSGDEMKVYSPLNNESLICDFEEYSGHAGIDLVDNNVGSANKKGPVYAIASGKVVQTDYDENDGNFVVVDHKNGYYSYYAHLGEILCKTDTNVDQNTQLGTIGNSGNTQGYHLHLAMFDKDGNYVRNLSSLLTTRTSLQDEIRIEFDHIEEICLGAVRSSIHTGEEKISSIPMPVEVEHPVSLSPYIDQIAKTLYEEKQIRYMEKGVAGIYTSVTFEADKDKKAYISFTAYLYEISGKIILDSGEEISFTLHSLKTINPESDEPDGIWELKYVD